MAIDSNYGLLCITVPSSQTPYNSRKATATGRSAARTAGSKPPRTPMASAKITPITSKLNVILKAKAMFEKV